MKIPFNENARILSFHYKIFIPFTTALLNELRFPAYREKMKIKAFRKNPSNKTEEFSQSSSYPLYVLDWHPSIDIEG